MLVAGLSTLPNAAWEAIFAVMTAWFAWSLWRETRGLGAGVWPAAIMRRTSCTARRCACVRRPGGAGEQRRFRHGRDGGWLVQRHADAEVATLALVFVLALVAYTVRDLDRRACADGYFHVVARRLRPLVPHWPPRARPTRVAPTRVFRPSRPGAAAPPWRTWRGPGPLRWRRPWPPTPTAPGRTAPGRTAPGRTAPGGTVPGRTVPGRTVPGRSGTRADGTRADGTRADGTRADRGRVDTTTERLLLAPGVVKACRVAMGITMAFMLVIMI